MVLMISIRMNFVHLPEINPSSFCLKKSCLHVYSSLVEPVDLYRVVRLAPAQLARYSLISFSTEKVQKSVD
jgi:hypothetical protein